MSGQPSSLLWLSWLLGRSVPVSESSEFLPFFLQREIVCIFVRKDVQTVRNIDTNPC